MKIVAVSGSTGLIGRAVVKVLREKGYGVSEFVIDGKRGNVENLDEVKTFLKTVDGVIHLAAKIDLKTTWADFYKTNVIGSINIAKIAAKNNIRMVMVSTIMVFKDSNGEEKNEKWEKRNGSDNNYIRSKLEADKEVGKINKKVITVYPCIVIDKNRLGDHQVTESGWAGWIWKNIGGGINGGIMALIGRKNRHMNIVEVEDVAQGIVLAWEKGKPGDDYILGGENIKVEDYLTIMGKKFGVKRFDFRIPEWPFWLIKGISGWLPMPMIVVNMAKSVGGEMNFKSDKAKKILGYRPVWKLSFFKN